MGASAPDVAAVGEDAFVGGRDEQYRFRQVREHAVRE
jgi:hypothetical protein